MKNLRCSLFSALSIAVCDCCRVRDASVATPVAWPPTRAGFGPTSTTILEKKEPSFCMAAASVATTVSGCAGGEFRSTVDPVEAILGVVGFRLMNCSPISSCCPFSFLPTDLTRTSIRSSDVIPMAHLSPACGATLKAVVGLATM